MTDPTPQQRLGLDLQRFCTLRGVRAGITPIQVEDGAQAPGRSWRWDAHLDGVHVSGMAPSLRAARLDLRAALRTLGVVE